MNKSELIKEVALKRKLSFNEATNAVDAIMEAIAETTSGGGWDFSYIRRINIMLSHLGDGVLNQKEEQPKRNV